MKKDSKLEKLILLIAKCLPSSNHLITTVEHNGLNYIFDPTNDGLLQNKNSTKIAIASNSNVEIRNHTIGIINIFHNLLGQYPDGINLVKNIIF